MVWQRILFGTLMIAALLGVIALDAWLSSGAAVSATSMGGSLEAFSCLPCALPMTLLVVLLVVLFFAVTIVCLGRGLIHVLAGLNLPWAAALTMQPARSRAVSK